MISKKTAEKLVTLLERWTRCEIMARHGEFGHSLEWTDYSHKEVVLRDKIRKLLYGSSNLVELGEAWGMLKKEEHKRTKMKKE